MKIAILGLSPNVGGVETFIINVYRELKKDNHSFYFFSTSEDKLCFQDEIENNGDHIIRYTPRKKDFIQFNKELNDIFTKNQFDIFWLNCCSLSSVEELHHAYKHNVPVRIVHSHNSKNMGGTITKVLHSLNKLSIDKYVTHYFACSKVAADWMFPKRKKSDAYIFHNAIDVKKYTFNQDVMKKMRKEYGIDDQTKIIGHVGRFHFQKNHTYLIRIFKEYLKYENNAKLILCGDGELKQEIINLIDELNISDKVLLLGNKNNMFEIYQMFDAILFPSLFEGLPFVLVEAQAAGIPCLISNTISKEIKFTDLIRFKSLEENEDSWAKALKEMTNIKKYDTSISMKNAGYDIAQNRIDFYNVLEERK